MSGIVNGTQILLYIDGQPVFSGVSNDESAKNDLRETTSKMSGGYAEYAGGKKSIEGTAEGLFCEQMKNLVQFPEDFSSALWVATGCTKTANFGTAPNGKKVSGRLTSISNGDKFLQLIDGTIYNSTQTYYTFSVWLKGTAATTISLELMDGGSTEYLPVKLTTSFVRYEFTFLSSGDGSDIYFGLNCNTDTATSCELAQPQMEIGQAATPYQQSGNLYPVFFDALMNGTALACKTGSLEVGSDTYTGTAIISDLKRTMPMEANVTFSLSYKISGLVTQTTIS